MPIQAALDAFDDLVTYLDNQGYKHIYSTDGRDADAIFWDLTFEGIELDDNDTNPGGMPALTLTLSTLYTSDFAQRHKDLMEAELTVMPKLIEVGGGQVEDESVSFSPDPDATTVPNRIGITMSFVLRDGLVSLKD